MSSGRLALSGRAAAHVALPLLVGGLIYIAGRTTALLMWDWARTLGIEGASLALRASLAGIAGALPDWARFSLPDALWVYALTIAVAHLQRGSSRLVRTAYLAIPFVLGPGAELAQAAGWLPGTFDIVDLVLCALAFGGALLVDARARAWRSGEEAPGSSRQRDLRGASRPLLSPRRA